MALDVANIIGGPAVVIFDGVTYYTEGDIEIAVDKRTRDQTTSVFGKVDHVLLDVRVEIRFRPTMWVSASLSKLVPYLSTAIGTRVFGDTDKAVVIQSVTEGNKWTFSRGAVTGPPTLGFGVEKDTIGQMTITALKANATALSSSGAVAAIASSAFSDTSFNPALLFDVPPSVTYGAGAILDAADTEDGVNISFTPSFEDVMSDQEGILDMRLTGYSAEASFIPIGVAHADLLSLMQLDGTSMVRGAKLGTGFGADLVVEGLNDGEPTVTLHQAHVVPSSIRFSSARNLPGEITFRTARKITSGALTALATIGVVSS